jgi:bifunctional oligoribonuclease and PAP phosphatase NrnA
VKVPGVKGNDATVKSSVVLTGIVEMLEKHRTFCVVGHMRPDGDCIGSQLALALALRGRGKRVVCWNEDAVPQKLAFLDGEGLFAQPVPGGKFDCVVAADCASYERLGRAGEALGRRRVLINIDHHQSNTQYGDLNWVESGLPSTGELVYRLLKFAGWPVTPAIADCLYTAISTDTGSFQYSSTLPETYAVAGQLVKLGANVARICEIVYQSFPLSRVRLLRHVYNSFRLAHGDRTAYVWLRKADYVRAGAHSDDSEGLIDHIRAIEPVVVACVFEEMEPELTRVSLRSKNPGIRVNEILAPLGGGGHYAAAGARIKGRPAHVQRLVLRAVEAAYHATS